MSTKIIERIGDLISLIGCQKFEEGFCGAFQDLLNIRECTVFHFVNQVPQSLLVQSDSNQALAKELAADYVSGGYADDPNINTLDAELGVSVQVTDPEDIENTSFRHHFYRKPEFRQELAILGSQDGSLYYTSFYKKQSEEKFSKREVDTMRSVASVIVKLLHRHRQVRHLIDPAEAAEHTFSSMKSEDSREKILRHLQKVLASGRQKLSAREAEVCAAIILGYSTEAIALNLSISANTVATHRKRAYSKLGISSQNELFSNYFSKVREFQSVLGA